MKANHPIFDSKAEPVLRQSVAEILLQGLQTIENIDDDSFTDGGRGSVGTHFRHCLDFASNFLRRKV